MSSNTDSDLTFTADELDLLSRTADALSAYMGKPVLAEVIDAQETGFEWVLFAVPLGTDEPDEGMTIVQIGSSEARLLGNLGGLSFTDGDIYDCEYLWAVQLSDLEGVRYIKVDQQGEEVAWSDELRNILPFALVDEPLPDDDEEDDEPDDDDTDEDDGLEPRADTPSPTLH